MCIFWGLLDGYNNIVTYNNLLLPYLFIYLLVCLFICLFTLAQVSIYCHYLAELRGKGAHRTFLLMIPQGER